MDLVSTLLCLLLNEIVYVEQLYGSVQGVLVCQSKQALYGLNQAQRVLYSVIQNFF